MPGLDKAWPHPKPRLDTAQPHLMPGLDKAWPHPCLQESQEIAQKLAIKSKDGDEPAVCLGNTGFYPDKPLTLSIQHLRVETRRQFGEFTPAQTISAM